MADTYTAAPNVPLSLAAVAAAPLPTTLRELVVEVDPAAGAATARATLELTAADYRRAAWEGLLGLDVPGRGPGPEPAGDAPVRVTCRLRPYLAEPLAGAEDAMAVLLPRLLGEAPDLAHAEAWRAVDVAQAVPGQAEVSLGYATGWAALDRIGPLEDMAERALARQGLAFERTDSGILRATPPPAGTLAWTLLVRGESRFGLFATYGVLAEAVPPARRAEAAAALARLTAEVPIGGFDLDPDDGEVRLRLDQVTMVPVIALDVAERMIAYVRDTLADNAVALADIVRGTLPS